MAIMELNDIKKASREFLTKPLVVKVYKVKNKGIQVKIDGKKIDVPVGKYVVVYPNDIMKIFTHAELEESFMQI